MVSKKTKKIILVELTVPWENRCTQAHERKKAKYEDLVKECREAGWRAWNYPIEVGCRRFPAPSLGKMFQDMGIVEQARKMAIKKVSQAAERSSSWLWLRRNASSWKPSTNGKCLINTAARHLELVLGEAYTETAQCVCGNICKIARGLKIHRSRKGCQPDPEQRQCTDLSGETQEDPTQEEQHSAEDLHESEVEQMDEPTRTEHDFGSQGSRTDDRLWRIKWPAMNDKQWKEFDEDVDSIVERCYLEW
ncbi:uncharacterized protein LOC127869755 [Dreissena polymorpha]|uniref:uncharacterized protein LOC127869755 n=1 Tax=Dreissena polymorpha TaxID=45954 RepID=UPI002264CEAD|nr:uncharacterized protein LOC127869755 [Dreissena polymorpha]